MDVHPDVFYLNELNVLLERQKKKRKTNFLNEKNVYVEINFPGSD